MADIDQPTPSTRLALTRAGIGLVQGLALFVLAQWDKELLKTLAWGYGTLVVGLLFLPVVALGAFGTLRRDRFILWLGIATIVVLGLCAYQTYFTDDVSLQLPPAPMIIFTLSLIHISEPTRPY